jgi:HSP20 family protein
MVFRSLVPWRDRTEEVTRREEAQDPFLSFRREVDRMFDDFFSGFGRGLTPIGRGWQGVTPVVDVDETDKELVVSAELPGLEPKDFEVTLSGDLLTIKGEKKAEREQKDGEGYYMERRFGSFSRAVRLPFEVADEKVDAKYDKGVLTIRVPKPAEAQRAVRRIEIKGS